MFLLLTSHDIARFKKKLVWVKCVCVGGGGGGDKVIKNMLISSSLCDIF